MDFGKMVYEIDFEYDGYEYEYDINAETGEIIKSKKEIEIDDVMPSGSTPSTGNTGTPYGQHHEEIHHGNSHHDYGTTTPAQNAGNGTGTGSTSTGITLDQAKEIALNHAGQSASSVYFKKAELDYDDGIQVYEIEFVSENTEYEYEINAATGDIWDYDWDHD